MLANNFRTATDLGISDIEFESLVKVLGMLERGEIKERQLHMHQVGSPECGTPACILGWARHVAHDSFPHRIFPERGTMGVRDLFLMCASARTWTAVKSARAGIGPAQAAIALRNYLVTGEPKWSEALT